LAQKAGLAIHSLNGPVPTAQITDTVRGTWRTLGFWFGTFGAAVQGRTAPVAAPVPCGTDPCPPKQQPAPPDPRIPSRPGRATAVAAASRYWAGHELEVAVAIAGAESSYRPTASLTYHGAHMRGLWQINDGAHPALIRPGDWRNPADNAWMAHQVWLQAGRSWRPWSTYTSGSYRRFLAPVRATAAAFAPQLNQPAPPAPCPSPTAPPTGPGQTRVVRDVTSGAVYRVPMPTGPRGVALGFALDQEEQGDWYRWAAHGPDRWDCSGLVSGAWAHAGYHVYPQTEVLVRQELHVSRAQPGDLLWHPGHVVMVVGIINGRTIIVEAPHTGSRLRIRPLWFRPKAILDPMGRKGEMA